MHLLTGGRFGRVRFADLLLVACVALAIGCGSGEKSPPIAAVSGKVTSKGQPLTEGTISFMSQKGFGASAEIQGDGSYRMISQYGRGIPLGDYLVSISPPTPKSEGPIPADRAPASKEYPQIPQKYRAFATSSLEAKVGEAGGEFNFDMKSE